MSDLMHYFAGACIPIALACFGGLVLIDSVGKSGRALIFTRLKQVCSILGGFGFTALTWILIIHA